MSIDKLLVSQIYNCNSPTTTTTLVMSWKVQTPQTCAAVCTVVSISAPLYLIITSITTTSRPRRSRVEHHKSRHNGLISGSCSQHRADDCVDHLEDHHSHWNIKQDFNMILSTTRCISTWCGSVHLHLSSQAPDQTWDLDGSIRYHQISRI